MKEKSKFFSLLFDNFNKFNLKYSLMNGYESYPESIGSDIDICVENMNKYHYVEKTIVNYRLCGISAQMKLLKFFKEGYSARQSAGMSFLGNLLSLLVRVPINLLKRK